jgi:predicted DNA-binding mobile mystery protein A
MTAKQRKLRRQQLDRQLSSTALSAIPPRPQGGWIQAIREALGMTLDAFGSRLGISRQTAHQLEQAEAEDSITLKRLRTAAEALDCELIVLLRPKQPLEDALRNRARAVARQLVTRTGHSMAMEEQAVSRDRLEEMIEEASTDLIDKHDPRLWR